MLRYHVFINQHLGYDQDNTKRFYPPINMISLFCMIARSLILACFSALRFTAFLMTLSSLRSRRPQPRTVISPRELEFWHFTRCFMASKVFLSIGSPLLPSRKRPLGDTSLLPSKHTFKCLLLVVHSRLRSLQKLLVMLVINPRI